jgi:hypothetical protein
MVLPNFVDCKKCSFWEVDENVCLMMKSSVEECWENEVDN